MPTLSNRVALWAPRAISLAFVGFLSLFALDVFNEHLGFWQTLAALARHLIPSFVLLAVLVLAWRWEWIGALFYAAAGLLYVISVESVPATVRLLRIAAIAGPAFLIAALFLVSWLRHSRLHAAH